jgi:ribonuclease HI
MSKNKFYAVAKGRRPGIYDAWFGPRGAEVQVRGFTGAVFKGFTFRREAEVWIEKNSGDKPSQERLRFASEDKVNHALEDPRSPGKPAEERHSSQTISAGDRVVIYTDGGCSKNPGPGGYGVVMLLKGQRRELSGGFARTTNNRMELTACIIGLEALDGQCSVTLHSDSQYVVNGITKGWARRWKRNNWMRNADEHAENSDLWARLLDLCEMHDVQFQWVRGHNGNRENERCDTLAVQMTRKRDLPVDTGYTK